MSPTPVPNVEKLCQHLQRVWGRLQPVPQVHGCPAMFLSDPKFVDHMESTQSLELLHKLAGEASLMAVTPLEIEWVFMPPQAPNAPFPDRAHARTFDPRDHLLTDKQLQAGFCEVRVWVWCVPAHKYWKTDATMDDQIARVYGRLGG